MRTLALERGELDLSTGLLCAGEERVQLTEIERRLVAFLAERPGQAVSREELQRTVWGYRPGVLSRTVFTTVGRLRCKLERTPESPRHLVTVPGEGYALHVEREAIVRSPERLPQPPSPLVGRQGELATLRAALDGGARLLTLHGPGGVGKTRLAVELARLHPGPTRFVALEGRASAEELPDAIAEAVGVELGRGPDPLGELAIELGPARWLLVLDNLEHLLPAATAGVEGLLSACPGLQVVVTSRRRIGLQAEHVLRVDDLDLPVDGGDLHQVDAGRLLLQVASRVRLGWTPDPAERQDLARICQRVGGSPLALELAAAWLRLLEPAEIGEELARSDALLRADETDRPARHRSITVALEASWHLLDPRAAEVLQALATLHGPFDRALAADVAGADLLVLGQLVDSAMLRRGSPGFALHPLVRRDARRRLAADPPRAALARRRHRAALLARVDQAAQAPATPGSRPFAALAPLRADVLAALRGLVEEADLDALGHHLPPLLACVEALHPPGELITALHDAARHLEAAGAEASGGEAARAWACALRLLGVGAGGPLPDDLDAAVARAATLGGAPAVLALTHGAIGTHQRGEPERGLSWAQRALAIADERAASPFLRSFPRGVAGSLLLRLGRLDPAREVLEQAITLGRGGPGRSRSMVHLGQVQLALGEVERARATLSDAIALLRDEGDRTFLVMALTALAAAEQAAGADPEPILLEAMEEGARSRLPPV